MTITTKSDQLIQEAAIRAAGIGVGGAIIPMIDLPAMGFIWIKLTTDLAKESGQKLSWLFAIQYVAGLTGSAALYMGGCKLFSMALHAFPGLGTIGVVIINAVLNWLFTLRLGKMLASSFNSPGFNRDTVMLMVKSAAATIVAMPTYYEVVDALDAIGDLLHLSDDTRELFLDAVGSVLENEDSAAESVSLVQSSPADVAAAGTEHSPGPLFGSSNPTLPIDVQTESITANNVPDWLKVLNNVSEQHDLSDRASRLIASAQENSTVSAVREAVERIRMELGPDLMTQPAHSLQPHFGEGS